MLSYSGKLTTQLHKYALKKSLLQTLKFRIIFYFQKIDRIILRSGEHIKSFAVLAPDGGGKTTFLDELIKKLVFYFVEDAIDNKFHLYHFRPNLLPNLGEVGENIGIMVQNKNFSNPHRSKPANFISSLGRITYYWLDYLLGWQIFVRKDVQKDRFTIFDRYGYDLIVDPERTKLNLPFWIRKLFVHFMPHPKIIFYLDASPEIIFMRKKELTYNEIVRQVKLYREIAKSDKRFVTLNAERPVDLMVNDALKIIIDRFCEKLKNE